MPRQIIHPELSDAQIARWNRLLLLVAELCHVPVALIMQVGDGEIRVAASAETGSTPYKVGDKEHLDSGLYCEHVMAAREELCVPDAIADPAWCHNPDVKLGMISYLGYPLCWPSGKIFGTICILDRVENHYSEHIRELMQIFKGVVQDQLALAAEKACLEATLAQLQASRSQLTEAVKLAVDQIVQKNEVMGERMHGFANMLDELAGSLVAILALSEPRQVESELSKMVEELNQTSERLLCSER